MRGTNRLRGRRVKDWAWFLDWHHEHVEQSPHELAFRGQAKASWTLVPSLFRLKNVASKGPDELLRIEQVALESYARRRNEFGAEFDSTLYGGLAFLQHYGVPTRLLDWSGDAFTALYFAVEGQWERDGALWMVDRAALGRAMRDRYEPQHGYEMSYHFAQGQLSQNWDDSPVLLIFRKIMCATRVGMQKGLFSISKTFLADHEQILGRLLGWEEANRRCAKLIIPWGLKPDFLRRLRERGIRADSLFEGWDAIGRSVRESLSLRFSRTG